MLRKLLVHFHLLQSSELQNEHIRQYNYEQGPRRGALMAIWTFRIVLPLVIVGGVALVTWVTYTLVVYLRH